MKYKVLADCYEELERTSSKLMKIKILAELYLKASEKDLPKIVLLSQSRVFPKYVEIELGMATQLTMRAIARATGFSEREVERFYRELGDLGLTAERCVKNKKQATLFKKTLTVDYVFKRLQDIGKAVGEGSQEKKLMILTELLLNSEPKEAKYIIRTVLGELRIGVAGGIVRDAIAEAFLVKKGIPKAKAVEAVEYAWNVLSDFSEVAVIALTAGLQGLKNVKPVLGRPIQVMLGIKAESIEEVLKRHPKVIVEYKYDGMRLQVHKRGNKVWLFTRRQENVTKQFPDIVEYIQKYIKAEECIVEGEAWPIDPKTKTPLPFQKLSQRIQRKYDIHKMMKEIPVQLNLFDMVYLDGKTLFDKPLIERIKILGSIVKQVQGKIMIAERIITSDLKEIEEFYHKALRLKQEGIMIKNPNSPYIFGRHVGGWYKIKPTMETLDLVIVGATWGEGRRAKWLSSYVLAVRDPDTGEFLTCGMMGTGLTEEQFEKMTQILKPLIIEESGREVKVKPKIVVEVGYQEIQKSPNYESGYALRFPRLIRVRNDKGPEDVDTLNRLAELYKSQGKEG
ncbi:MAG: ATP-dependent DNA ligase [Candidatus Aenigmarchaeota archaeon]|nr:ATP-dependent DNA ligase [Candidatus Aenigmarchaeota archaeon]